MLCCSMQVVDMLLFRTFAELTEADVSADPLILLPCGHLFLASTLDGHMEMSGAYSYSRMPCSSSDSNATTATNNGSSSSDSPATTATNNGSSSSDSPATTATNNSSSSSEAGHPSNAAAAADADSATQSDLEPWGSPLHRNDFPPPKWCPDCRRVVAGVRRYGRVVLHSQLGVIQRKHAQAIRWVLDMQALAGCDKLRQETLAASEKQSDLFQLWNRCAVSHFCQHM